MTDDIRDINDIQRRINESEALRMEDAFRLGEADRMRVRAQLDEDAAAWAETIRPDLPLEEYAWPGLRPALPLERQLEVAEMLSALRALRRDTPDVHVACTHEWFESRKREHERREGEELKYGGMVPSPAATLGFGIPVFVTDDVTAERGWEVRPGRHPEDQT